MDSVDGSEIRSNHLGCTKPLVNPGVNYQPELVQDFFHQKYDPCREKCMRVFG